MLSSGVDSNSRISTSKPSSDMPSTVDSTFPGAVTKTATEDSGLKRGRTYFSSAPSISSFVTA